MRCLLFILALLAIGAFAQNCTTVTCVQVGDACFSTPQDNEVHLCENSHCSDDDTCHTVADFGAACGASAGDAVCVAGASKYYSSWNSDCLSGLCGAGQSYQTPSGPGDNCSFTEPLLGSLSRGGCFVGTNCTSGGFCEFADEGATCSQNCRGGFYCKFDGTSAFSCVALGKEGDACSFTDPCNSGLVCGSAGTCVPLFSVAEGEACSTTNFAPVGRSAGSFSALPVTSECAAGLGCVAGSCATIDTSKVGNDCVNDTDCGDGYTCFDANSCENPGKHCALTAYPVDQQLSDLWAAFQQCLATNNCSYGLQTQLPFKGQEFENCAQRQCFSEWTAYVDAWFPSTAYTECSTAPATTTGPTGGGPTGPAATTNPTTGSGTTTRSGSGTTATTSGAATLTVAAAFLIAVLALLL